MLSKDEAIEKVRKLLALSKSDNPHEAANAAVRAQEIMDRYEIQANMLDNSKDDEFIRQFFVPLDGEDNKRLITWRCQLAMAIAKNNGCTVYTSGPKIMLVGRGSDGEIVRIIYEWLITQIEQISSAKCKGEGKTYSNNFKLGCVDTIKIRLTSDRKQLAEKIAAENTAISTEQAIVLVNKALDKINQKAITSKQWMYQNVPGLNTRAFGEHRGDYGAREAGRSAGWSISMNKPSGYLKG